jgi:hypothetical protein
MQTEKPRGGIQDSMLRACVEIEKRHLSRQTEKDCVEEDREDSIKSSAGEAGSR